MSQQILAQWCVFMLKVTNIKANVSRQVSGFTPTVYKTTDGTTEMENKLQLCDLPTHFCYSVLLLCSWVFVLQCIKSKIRLRVKINGLENGRNRRFSRLRVQSGVKAQLNAMKGTRATVWGD